MPLLSLSQLVAGWGRVETGAEHDAPMARWTNTDSLLFAKVSCTLLDWRGPFPG
jgi:hypothetical protein